MQSAVAAEITALWQTDEVRARRPSVSDEVKMGLDYYHASIFATVPALYAELASAFAAEYGRELSPEELPLMLSFGSWIGGDRDGNPFVTTDVTISAIAGAREHVLGLLPPAGAGALRPAHQLHPAGGDQHRASRAAGKLPAQAAHAAPDGKERYAVEHYRRFLLACSSGCGGGSERAGGPKPYQNAAAAS